MHDLTTSKHGFFELWSPRVGPSKPKNVRNRPASQSRACRVSLRPRQPLSRAERAHPSSAALGCSERSRCTSCFGRSAASSHAALSQAANQQHAHRDGRELLPSRAARERRSRSGRRAARQGRTPLRDLEPRVRMSGTRRVARQRERVRENVCTRARTSCLGGIECRRAARTDASWRAEEAI